MSSGSQKKSKTQWIEVQYKDKDKKRKDTKCRFSFNRTWINLIYYATFLKINKIIGYCPVIAGDRTELDGVDISKRDPTQNLKQIEIFKSRDFKGNVYEILCSIHTGTLKT